MRRASLRTRLTLATTSLTLAAIFQPAFAAELKVLTAGACKPIALAMTPAFEKQTGHTLKIENDTAGALERRIAQGESFDVAIMPPAAFERLAQTGQDVLAEKGMESAP